MNTHLVPFFSYRKSSLDFSTFMQCRMDRKNTEKDEIEERLKYGIKNIPDSFIQFIQFLIYVRQLNFDWIKPDFFSSFFFKLIKSETNEEVKLARNWICFIFTVGTLWINWIHWGNLLMRFSDENSFIATFLHEKNWLLNSAMCKYN